MAKRKGRCPRCGDVMEWKIVDFNPLNFLIFTGNPIVRAWKCQKCKKEINRTDLFEKTDDPLPFDEDT